MTSSPRWWWSGRERWPGFLVRTVPSSVKRHCARGGASVKNLSKFLFGEKDLTGFEIVVASSNNGAVENVTLEIPGRAAVDESWLAEVDYFADIGERLIEQVGLGYGGREAWQKREPRRFCYAVLVRRSAGKSRVGRAALGTDSGRESKHWRWRRADGKPAGRPVQRGAPSGGPAPPGAPWVGAASRPARDSAC